MYLRESLDRFGGAENALGTSTFLREGHFARRIYRLVKAGM